LSCSHKALTCGDFSACGSILAVTRRTTRLLLRGDLLNPALPKGTGQENDLSYGERLHNAALDVMEALFVPHYKRYSVSRQLTNKVMVIPGTHSP